MRIFHLLYWSNLAKWMYIPLLMRTSIKSITENVAFWLIPLDRITYYHVFMNNPAHIHYHDEPILNHRWRHSSENPIQCQSWPQAMRRLMSLMSQYVLRSSRASWKPGALIVRYSQKRNVFLSFYLYCFHNPSIAVTLEPLVRFQSGGVFSKMYLS